LPAHASPLAATCTTLGLLEMKEISGEGISAVPDEFWAAEVKETVLPISSETSLAGLSVTIPGVTVWVGAVETPLPPQPKQSIIKDEAITVIPREPKRLMHPPRSITLRADDLRFSKRSV